MTIALTQPHPAFRPGALRSLAAALGSGIAVLIVGEAVWMSLLATYTRHPTAFPWFVPAMALFLMAAAAWMKWGTWPRYGSVERNAGVRLNAVSRRTFLLALVTGWSTFFAGAGVYVAYRISSGVGGEVPMTVPAGPKSTVIAALAMAAIVAAVIEEVAVRGFMQGRLEKAFGLVPAILISGFVWALFHTNHSYFDTSALNVAIWFGIFLMVSAMLGTIARLTDSVLPGIVIHAGFDGTYFVPAAILQPKIAPLTFLESLASPHAFLAIAAVLALLSLAAWIALFRSVGAR
jgi:membrane protease YdiL (CAAX protease family)